MKDLIKKLQCATGPDRELDAEIASLCNSLMPNDPVGWPEQYTGSADVAMELIPEGWNRRFSESDTHKWWAELREGFETSYNRVAIGQAATLPLAICAAALEARAALTPHKETET